MAARLNPRHTEMVRTKIKVRNIIVALEEHVFGKRELTAAQVASARILLDKSMANLPQPVELTGQEGGPIICSVKFVAAKAA